MREIEFRVWDNKFKEMQYIDLFWFEEQGIREIDDLKHHELILEQYTGLKDKNGVEIYEGDIYQFQFMQELYKGVIKYKKELARFVIELEDLAGKWCEFPKQSDDTNYFCEVIGNIHEKGDK